MKDMTYLEAFLKDLETLSDKTAKQVKKTSEEVAQRSLALSDERAHRTEIHMTRNPVEEMEAAEQPQEQTVVEQSKAAKVTEQLVEDEVPAHLDEDAFPPLPSQQEPESEEEQPDFLPMFMQVTPEDAAPQEQDKAEKNKSSSTKRWSFW